MPAQTSKVFFADTSVGAVLDTYLYRSASGTLTTDGNLFIKGNLAISGPVSGAVGGGQLYKFPIYNSANGGLVGYVPVYGS